MSDFDLVVSGTVVQPHAVLEDGYVAVRSGTVKRVGKGSPPLAKDVIDFGDAFIMPGAIDAQVHSRSQKGQEDFVWSTRAAAAGGVTTIVDMPYDDGELICNAERFERKAREAGEQARVDFALYATIDPREGAVRIPELANSGAAAFKFSTFETHPERFPRISPPMLYECFDAIRSYGLIAGVHNENDESVRAFTEKIAKEGRNDYIAHGLSRPPFSEALAIAEVYELAAATGCSGHIVHCSIGRGYDLCRAYQSQGFDTTIEACIHYLMLDEDNDVSRLGGFAKVNPPIRGRTEREQLWHHLAAGNITVVSTDHVSWSEDRKNKPKMLENGSGVPSLEVLYSLLLTGLLQRNLSPILAARLLAANPARLFRIGHQKGALEVGCDADIVVMAHQPGKYDPTRSGHNFVSWSPYQGIDLSHRPVATFLRGRQVFDGTTVAEPGTGQFVRPTETQA